MFFYPGLKGASSFAHMMLWALGTPDFVYYPAFLGVRCFVFGVDQDRAKGVERLVVCTYSVLSEDFGQFF